ncbi:MAG TPA: hypothetical protein DEQ78_01210, partial [Ruminococcaceae bacterium]|nr:hypothetical protein [Oscillospiraceae bacterium]
LGLPPLVPVGGYAPATPFLNKQEVFRQTETAGTPAVYLYLILSYCTSTIVIFSPATSTSDSNALFICAA